MNTYGCSMHQDPLTERLKSLRGIPSLLCNIMIANMGHDKIDQNLNQKTKQRKKGETLQSKKRRQKRKSIRTLEEVKLEHQRALKEFYKTLIIPGIPKADIDRYLNQVKLHIKPLIKDQLKELTSTKLIMTLWIK